MAAARQHPAYYARLVSGGKWRAPRHIQELCRLLVDVWAGKLKRLAISCPPRHGKSLLISQYFPGWWLGTRPTNNVILTSYQERLVRRWSRKVRSDLATWGPKLWGHGPAKNASTASWEVLRGGLPAGGAMDAVGTGGALTGKGAHLLVCDDLFKGKQEADSEAIRENVWDWFTSEALTRLEPGGAAVVVFTRWHFDDVIGRLEASQRRGDLLEPWTFVNLPALAVENDPLGRVPGEALWPERFPVERLEAIRQEVGPHVWQSLYQGAPVPAAGQAFKREWLRYAEVVGDKIVFPDGRTAALEQCFRFGTVDLAVSTKTSADYTVMQAWAVVKDMPALVLLEQRRARIEGPDLVPALEALTDAWGLAVLEVEAAGFQLAITQQARRAGLPIRELKPDKDKIARAQPATAAFSAGQVWLPKGRTWLADFETELLQFPSAAHYDQVDAMAYAVLVFQRFLRFGRGDDGNRYESKQPKGPAGPRWRIGR
jgi:predicted phage terminase large subunit-like protein